MFDCMTLHGFAQKPNANMHQNRHQNDAWFRQVEFFSDHISGLKTDIIGDVHGCFDEINTLLQQLGYEIEAEGAEYRGVPPEGLKSVFVGDLVDCGPKSRKICVS